MFPPCNEELRLRYPSCPTSCAELMQAYVGSDLPTDADSPHSRAVAALYQTHDI